MNDWDALRLRVLQWIPAIAGLIYLWGAFGPQGGFVGHDYYAHFTELLIGKYTLTQFGFQVPYFSPWTCGGTPFLADPQSLFFSLPQFLSVAWDPLLASRMSILIFYALGYLGVFFALHKRLALSSGVSHLAALFFLFNGFSFLHLLVGHLTHHSYLILPWVFIAAAPRAGEKLSTNFLRAAVVASLCAYIFWSGGSHILVLLLWTGALLAPFLFNQCPRQKLRLRALLIICMAAVIFFCLIAAKLVPALAYSQHFYEQPLHRSFEPLFKVVWRYFFFLPSSLPRQLPFGELSFGPWEFVGFISKTAIPLFLVGLIFALRHKYRKLLFIQLTLVLVLALFATGRLHNGFPLVEKYHNPIKWLGALIPLCTLAFGYALTQLSQKTWFQALPERSRQLSFACLATILFTEFTYYGNYFLKNRTGLSFAVSQMEQVDSWISSGKPLPPVNKIVKRGHHDLKGLLLGETSLLCYEPVFGYRQQALKTKLLPAPTSLQKDNTFNITHPGCFLAPNYYQCQAWDRFPAAKKEQFSRFVQGDPTAIPIAPKLKAYGWLSFLTFLVLLVLFCGWTLQIKKSKP